MRSFFRCYLHGFRRRRFLRSFAGADLIGAGFDITATDGLAGATASSHQQELAEDGGF